MFDPLKEESTDRDYPGLQLDPIESGSTSVYLFLLQRVQKDKGALDP